GGMPDGAFVRVVREDPLRKGLLYAGTERGVYVSFDDGGRWQPLQMALPGTVTPAASPAPSPSPSPSPSAADEKLAGKLPGGPVADLVVKDNDVVVAQQGW